MSIEWKNYTLYKNADKRLIFRKSHSFSIKNHSITKMILDFLSPTSAMHTSMDNDFFFVNIEISEGLQHLIRLQLQQTPSRSSRAFQIEINKKIFNFTTDSCSCLSSRTINWANFIEYWKPIKLIWHHTSCYTPCTVCIV